MFCGAGHRAKCLRCLHWGKNPAAALGGKCIIIAILQLSKVRIREGITCSRSELTRVGVFEPRSDVERQTQEVVEPGVF